MKAIASAVLAAVLLSLSLPAEACSLDRQFMREPAPFIVPEAGQIVWARALAPENSPEETPKFEVIEVLKGEVPEIFEVPEGRYVSTRTAHQRLEIAARGHRAAETGKLQIAGVAFDATCRDFPTFVIGEAYLIFLDYSSWASFEPVRDEDDLWYRRVRDLLDERCELNRSGVSALLHNLFGPC